MPQQLSLIGTDVSADTSTAAVNDPGYSSDDQLLDSYSRTISAVVNRVAPSVVNIRILSGTRGQGGGSGFIIARDGFILTNSHVVHGARELEVTLHDARVYRAQLIGTDPDTDLGVIRIDAPDLQHVRFADWDRFASVRSRSRSAVRMGFSRRSRRVS